MNRGLVLGSNVISSRIPVSSMEIDEQTRSEVFDEQSRRSEASGFPSRVFGCVKVFDGQSLRVEASGSSSTVTGSLSVSSSSFACSDDDGSSTVSADDGSSTVVPADDVSSTVSAEDEFAGSDGSALSTGSDGFAGSDGFNGSDGFDGLDVSDGFATALDESVRKDTRAWFFGWLRAGVQHDERLLAKLEVIVEKTSRATQATPCPYRSSDMLRMREELASLDAVRRQDMAIAWVQALSGQGDM
jgi:hypothetical protein